MSFTKKQISFATVAVSVAVGIVVSPLAGFYLALGVFIIVTS